MPRLGPKIQKALNIMSEPWRQIALLAKKCHPMPQGRSYVDEVNWFVMITEETRDPMYVIEAGQAETADPFLSKGALVKSLRAHLHQLKQGKSPEKTGSALGALYEASIIKAGSDEEFRTGSWLPYLTAQGKFIDKLESNPEQQVVRQKELKNISTLVQSLDGNPYLSSGPGTGLLPMKKPKSVGRPIVLGEDVEKLLIWVHWKSIQQRHKLGQY